MPSSLGSRGKFGLVAKRGSDKLDRVCDTSLSPASLQFMVGVVVAPSFRGPEHDFAPLGQRV